MYLDHKHSEREYIGLLAECPAAQGLWSGPSHGDPGIFRAVHHRIVAFDDGSVAKAREECTAGAIYKDVVLYNVNVTAKQGLE